MRQDHEYVYAIWREGSFSKAAEKLYMTQPALSVAIRKLEASLGMPVFDRRRRPLQLTEAGQVVIDAIERIRGTEDDMCRAIQDIRELRAGSLRIGGSHYLNACILPPVLTEFSRQYPGIKIELVESGSAELHAMPEARAIDVTFSCNPLLTERFHRTRAFQDTVLLAAAPGDPINAGLEAFRLTGSDILTGRHLRQDCPALPIDRFRDGGFILLSEGNNLHDRAWTMFREGDVTPRVKLELAQLATACHLAMAGFGITFVSDLIVAHPSVPLTFYRIDSPQVRRQFYAILPDRGYIPASVRRFIAFLAERTGRSRPSAGRAGQP